MIYFTGDMHGDPQRLSRSALRKLSPKDTLIVCGDFGFVWDNGKKEKKTLEKLSHRDIRVCFIDGTHENFDLLNSYPVVYFCGGRAHKITRNVFHLMRGQIYEIEDKTVFTFGGGENPELELKNDEEIDEHRPEVPTGDEMREGIENMDRADYKVDYIVTHEPPAGVKAFLMMSHEKTPDVSALGAYFDELSIQAKYKKWFFGSLHMDKNISASSVCVFENIVRG